MWKKIVAPVLVVGVLWIAGGAFTTYYLLWLHAALGRVLADGMSAARNAGAMEAALWKIHVAGLQSIQEQRSDVPLKAGDIAKDFEEALETATADARQEPEQRLIETIRLEYARYNDARRELLSSPDSANSADVTQTTDIVSRAAGACRDLASLRHQMLLESISRYAALTRGVNAFRLILFCTGPVLGILIGSWVSRQLSHSIQQISISLHDAAAGLNYDLGRVEVSPSTELPGLERQVQAITQRLQQVVDELNASRAETERNERLAAAGELAAGIAHELRNPLTSLKLVIQTAAKKQRHQPLSDRQFQILQDEIARMEASIQSLLDLARPPRMQPRLHNVCDTLRRSLNLVRTRAAQNDVVILEGLPNERVMIEGDPEQLHQVFVNLLLNAMEAMPDGGSLRVSLGGISELDAFCRIKFSDTGPGIASDLIDRIFEPFVSGKEHGHGLGLAVSRRIIQAHQGTITASNRPEGGALFTVALPYVTVQSESDTAPGERLDPREAERDESDSRAPSSSTEITAIDSDRRKEGHHVQTPGD